VFSTSASAIDSMTIRSRHIHPASVIVLPGDTWHFHWAKSGEYVTQVTAIGPLGLEYRDAKDDPRNKRHLVSSG
jgi:hypothetical protein